MAVTLLTGFPYTEVPFPDPVSLNGAMRLIPGASGLVATDLTGVTGTPTVGAYVKLANTVSTTEAAVIALIPLENIPAVLEGLPVYIQEFGFSGAKVDGTGTGVVAGTDCWVTAIGLYEAVETANSTTIAITSSLYVDTTDRLFATQSATPTDFSWSGIDTARTAGTKLYLGITHNLNDEAVDFRYYLGDHGYIRYTNRPFFRAT